MKTSEMKTSQKAVDKRLATRAKLLDAAVAILRDHGHVGLRLGSVSNLAGVSRGGLLHHFPTKQHLVAAVFDDVVRTMEAASWDRIKTADSARLFEAIVADAKDRFFSNSYQIMLDILVSCPNEDEMEAAKQQLRAELVVLALEGWQQRLEAEGFTARDARHVATFLWNLVRGLAIRSTVQTEPDYCDRIIAYAVRLLNERYADVDDTPSKGRVRGHIQ